MEYHLCISDNSKYLIKEVNRYLSEGWKLHGTTFVVAGEYHQAVVLEK